MIFSNTREQQVKSEPCSELELIAIRACAATLCCGTIKDEWFQKTVVPWLDQFMAAHEVILKYSSFLNHVFLFSIYIKIYPFFFVSFIIFK